MSHYSLSPQLCVCIVQAGRLWEVRISTHSTTVEISAMHTFSLNKHFSSALLCACTTDETGQLPHLKKKKGKRKLLCETQIMYTLNKHNYIKL